MNGIIKILLYVGLIGLAIWLVPFLLMVCWNYIAPLFNAPQLEWLHALCVAVIVGLLTNTRRDK